MHIIKSNITIVKSTICSVVDFETFDHIAFSVYLLYGKTKCAPTSNSSTVETLNFLQTKF